jgi:alkylation response protein AidB-like acyl-CoA dehydrogenase
MMPRRTSGPDYVINGVSSSHHQRQKKMWPSSSRSPDKAGALHERVHPAHAPGYSADRLEDKLGQHSSDTAQVTFDNCIVPPENPARKARLARR